MVYLDARGRVQVALRGIEHHHAVAGSHLEGVPWNRYVPLADSEHTAAPKHQITDVASLRIHHDVVHVTKIVALGVDHVSANQLVGTVRHLAAGDRQGRGDLRAPPAYPVPHWHLSYSHVVRVTLVDSSSRGQQRITLRLLAALRENRGGRNQRADFIARPGPRVTA